MAKVAFLGPACSFSHDLAREEFPDDEHVAFPFLHEVVAAIASGDCGLAVVPFYNTTRKSIEESQLELISHKNKVFVSNVLPLDVRHMLCGFGGLNEIEEIRSKIVVFHQVSKWQKAALPDATLKDYPSTSAAVKSLCEDGKPSAVAAIGTLSATKEYRVPVLKRNIQNKPNVTLFFVLESAMPKPEDMDHVLLCSPKASKPQKAQIEEFAGDEGCAITSNWPLTVTGGEAYFVELNGQYSKLGLHTAITNIRREFPKTFILGGYKGKCITQLLWAGESRRT